MEWSLDNLAPYIILIIGILLTISGFVLPLRHVLEEGYYCQHGSEPRYCSRMFPRLTNQTNVIRIEKNGHVLQSINK